MTQSDTILSLPHASQVDEHYSRAIEIYQQKLGVDHPDTRALMSKVSPLLVSVPLESVVYSA